MPEEPDVSPQEMEILDRIIQQRIEAKERLRASEVELIANRIMEALQSRPAGMNWAEIRAMFDKNVSDKQLRQALLTLETTPPKSTRLENNGDRSDERWALLAAS